MIYKENGIWVLIYFNFFLLRFERFVNVVLPIDSISFGGQNENLGKVESVYEVLDWACKVPFPPH